ncbi:MAG: DUF1223 domain-containing protein [Rhodocyclaceae bacterium]|nr:DUF1223 domain-containing protein [Rhodocyclaceae bacterium]
MKRNASLIALIALMGAGSIAPAGAVSGCVAQSGEQRAVLLELYTSEGCDSCPPADRRLSQWRAQGSVGGRLVPLAFHVDYWDRLGWSDRFASPHFTERQYRMASLARSRLVYTPQFLRNGRDWRSAGSPLEGLEELPPGAAIALEWRGTQSGKLTISGTIAAARPGAEAWLALYENKLESRVLAGENIGKVLRHDSVVRRLFGPLAPDASGKLVLNQTIALDSDWKLADMGAVAFVQDRSSGEILQALQRPACPL